MVQLILHKKTGFKNNFPTRPVIIRDFRGILFYSTEGLKPVEYFNLPEGNYFIETGYFAELPKPIKQKTIHLPMAERWKETPYNFSIKFTENPNKCTIDWDSKSIIFDVSFQSKSLPECYFVLYHEFGHSIYDTEKYADLYAIKMMLERGYNESQAGMAPITSLSENQYERKQFSTNQILL